MHLSNTNRKQFVPNWLQQIKFNSISEYSNEIIGRENFTETDNSEREEWMILADHKFNGNDVAKQTCVSQTDISLDEDQPLYTTEWIGDTPYWIDEQKKYVTRTQETNKTSAKWNSQSKLQWKTYFQHH